jgi:hypothetical protein
MRSVDGGKKWTTIADPKSFTYPTSAVFLSSTTGYALEQGRVVRTTNGGLDWDSTTSFFDHEGFTRLFLGPNNALYAGATDGLYHLVEHAAVHGDESASSSLACYPNPASRELTVEAPASSELSLFDAVGRLVWSAKTGEITRASCPTAMLPCGSYLLVAQRGGSVQRQSVVVQH